LPALAALSAWNQESRDAWRCDTPLLVFRFCVELGKETPLPLNAVLLLFVVQSDILEAFLGGRQLPSSIPLNG
jgi:hypothetical protein